VASTGAAQRNSLPAGTVTVSKVCAVEEHMGQWSTSSAGMAPVLGNVPSGVERGRLCYLSHLGSYRVLVGRWVALESHSCKVCMQRDMTPGGVQRACFDPSAGWGAGLLQYGHLKLQTMYHVLLQVRCVCMHLLARQGKPRSGPSCLACQPAAWWKRLQQLSARRS
jgi:hypothetical protein